MLKEQSQKEKTLKTLKELSREIVIQYFVLKYKVLPARVLIVL